MNYRIVVAPEAFDALDSYIEYITVEKQLPVTAERWLRKAWQAIQGLKTLPHRCPYAPENDHFDYTVRMRIVDNCLFLYRVDDEAKVVRVLRFRHGHQQPLRDLPESE